MPRPESLAFRSRTNTVIAVCVWVLCAGGLVAVAVLASGAAHRLSAIVPVAFVAVLAYELFYRPRVDVSDEAVVLVDYFRTTSIPWTAVVDVDTRWALTIVTPRRRYRSSAAPAPGPMSRPRMGAESSNPRVGRDGVVNKSDALGTDSGDAAYVVRARWQDLIEHGRIPIGRADSDRPTVRVHAVVLAATIVLGAASVPALIAI